MAADRGVELMRAARKQRGVALLTAILVVAIGTVLATNLMWLLTLDQRRTAAALAHDQGLQYALGAEAWAGDILQQDLVESPDSDHLGEFWAIEIDPLPIEGGFITGRIEDLQGRFNLNNLVTPLGEEDPLIVEQFERLLVLVDLDPIMAGAVVDWLDSDIDMRFPYGGEDEAYARAEPQYLAANGMMTTTSELMAIIGFDRESYAALSPYVAALPMGTNINVNTASDVVLASLSDQIDLSTARSLVDERAGLDFPNVRERFQGLVAEDMLPRIDGVSEHF
ncbi:MAG: type II secretion system minor pseudopilin GspK, partial [Gammaproteobacteria bacterium]|nr:type II secretion system minor pseudopilin GspK [Gammaproteobacteria bacterium]